MTKNTSLSPNPTGFDDFVYTYLEAKMAKSMTNVPLPTAANMTESAFRSWAMSRILESLACSDPSPGTALEYHSVMAWMTIILRLNVEECQA